MSDGMLKKYYQFELGQVCSRLSSGKGIAAKEISEHGVYPVFGGNGLRGYSDRKNFEGQCAIIGRQGAFCGNVRFFSGEAYMTEHAVVVCANEKSDIKYLSYLLGTLNLGRLSGQSAQPGLSVKTLSKQVIQLPDISKQRQIAKVLSAFDEKIELNTQINHNLEEQAKAILDQNCLAHKTLKVGDIVSFANGFAFKSSTYIEKGKFKVVTIKNVQDGKIDTSSADCVHEIPAKMKAECILNIGDVLLSLTGNVGRTGIVCENNLLLNQRVAKIIPHQSVLNAVCYFIFRRPEMKAALETIARGTAQANLSPVETLDIEIPFDIPTLQDIALYMKSFFEQIISNEMEIQTLAQLRDTLLPKLMSGEIDVSEVEV